MADNEIARGVLLEQADALGLKVDERWKVETLAAKVKEAQKAEKDARKADFDKADKVRVKLRRDAFPTDDVKVRAGELCDVPRGMARAWVDSGVAEIPFPD